MLKVKFFVKFGLLICLNLCKFNASYYALAQQEEQNNTPELSLADDSYRLNLNLKIPRRYLTRFDKETRTLQIRVIPANSNEFKDVSYYDNRFIQRVIVNEKDSEVTLNIQLKNFPIGWVIATQNNPWRIIVDFWRTEKEKPTLNEQWNWQPDYIAGKTAEETSDGLPATAGKIISKEVNIPISKKENISKKIVESEKNEKVFLAGTKNKKYDLPEIYSRLELIKNLSDRKKTELEKQIGSVFGSKDEFNAANGLAKILYSGGEEKQALTIFRKLLAQNETAFKADDIGLWQAGESAFLTKDFDIANDYFRSLVINHPGSLYAPYAKLRITDIDEIANSKNKGLGKVGPKNAEIYSSMALSDKNPQIIKIASSLRALDGVVDEDPDAVKTYQQNLDSCVTSSTVPFDLLKNCAYYRNRYLVENDSIISADIAVQKFKKMFPSDPRTIVLENIIERRVKSLLSETAKTKDYATWVNFEKKARTALLAFTFHDSSALFTRAEAFEAIGEDKKAIQIYESFIKTTADYKKKNEAASICAQLLYHINIPAKAEKFLKLISQDESRKKDGITERSVASLRELSVAPYRNKLALNILLDEMKASRYEEKDLSILTQWSSELRGKPQAELIYARILAYPAKSADETQIVEKSLFQYADDLRDAGQFSKAGDIYFAVANLSLGTRRAEAAYKAGVVYARAGLFEKAKTAWLLAANDTNDKRYSALANERLDRISK